MFSLMSKIKNKLVRYYGHDFFAFLSSDRSQHLKFVEDLKENFSKPEDMEQIANYSVSSEFLKKISPSSVVITGGVEFHIEFEDILYEKSGASFHFFEIDNRSVQWFKENKEKENFSINDMGLGAEEKRLPVYGNINMGFSSSANPEIYQNSKLNYQQIGESKITTVNSFCKEQNIDEIYLLKLDIEGMAIEVINSCWDDGILPKNIIMEIERPPKQKFSDYQHIVNLFIERAHSLKYNIIFLPRGDSFNSFTTEFFLSKD